MFSSERVVISKSLESLRAPWSQARVLSTIQRFLRTTHCPLTPLVMSSLRLRVPLTKSSDVPRQPSSAEKASMEGCLSRVPTRWWVPQPLWRRILLKQPWAGSVNPKRALPQFPSNNLRMNKVRISP